MMAELEKALGVEREFAVANSPWSNGTCLAAGFEGVLGFISYLLFFDGERNFEDI